jgi:hypothetical protein
MECKRIRILKYVGEYTTCDDCEGENKRPALWVVEGGHTGYLYLCTDHKEQYVNDLLTK